MNNNTHSLILRISPDLLIQLKEARHGKQTLTAVIREALTAYVSSAALKRSNNN